MMESTLGWQLMVVGGSFRGFGACLLWSEAVALNGWKRGRSRVSSSGAVLMSLAGLFPQSRFVRYSVLRRAQFIVVLDFPDCMSSLLSLVNWLIPFPPPYTDWFGRRVVSSLGSALLFCTPSLDDVAFVGWFLPISERGCLV